MLEDLVLIPVHTKPDDTEKELDELCDVFKAVKKKWKTKVKHKARPDNTSSYIHYIFSLIDLIFGSKPSIYYL